MCYTFLRKKLKAYQMKKNRKEQILNLLTAQGYTSVSDLASRFNVTTETIRRDLNQLERENLVKRIHGGAIASEKRSPEVEYQNRGQFLREEKKNIAQYASGLINDGETVIILSGTTTLAMAEFLLQKKNLTVITNSILLCKELASTQDIELYILGGKVRNGNYSISGPIAMDNLAVFNPDKVVIGIGGISVEKGLTDHRMDETLLTRNCLKTAGTTIGIADHSKFGTITSYTIGPSHMLNYLITSEMTPENVCEPYIKEGIKVVRVRNSEAEISASS